MTSLADAVARVVLDTYTALPKVGKPVVRPNGLAEWTILSALVAEAGGWNILPYYFRISDILRVQIALFKLGNRRKMFAR